MFARSPLRSLARLLLIATLAACNTTRPAEDPPPSVRGALDRLTELQPADVAIAPIRDQTNAQQVPVEAFRSAFSQTLVERRYSPLSPTYVDANWVDASFKGTPPPDALLLVSVTGWDPSHLFSTGVIDISADLVLFEGGDTTGRVLWQVSLEHEVNLGDGRGNPPAASRDLIPEAARLFAQRALRALPMRDPVAASRPEAADESYR